MHTPVRSHDVGGSTGTHVRNTHTVQSPDTPPDSASLDAGSPNATRQDTVSPATPRPSATDRDRADPASFASRLNRLFDTVRPPGRGPLRDSEVRRELQARGHQISAPYLSQLRSGTRDNPNPTTIRQLADLFGVRPEYFTGDDPNYTEFMDAELRWLDLAHDPDVRQIVSGLLQLPPEVREGILRTVDARIPSSSSG